MRAWGKIHFKSLFISKSASKASVPLIGSLLLLLILFVLTGAAFASFLSSSGGYMNFQPPVVNIEIKSCEGGLSNLSNGDEQARFDENFIVLVHGGGSSLPLKSTSIRISGYGNVYHGIPGKGGILLEGDILVFYHDLNPDKKNAKVYLANNKETLEDGYWGAGERLVLCGRDSAIGTADSSVKVSVGETKDTKDNYGFKVGSEIRVSIIDVQGRNLLAGRTAVVEAVNN